MTAIGSASHVKATNPLRIGLIGARSWVANQAVIPAIEASASCVLVAVGSSGGPVPQHLAHLDTGGYDRVLAHPDVEAVYVPLSNDQHRPWVERAAMAGKHVLCEKPLGLDGADAAAMVAVCEGAGVVLAEAWMTPFGARWAEIVGRAATGQLGEIRHLAATFTFPLDPKQTNNYRWNPGQGGGALLDVGIYALGAAVALWGAEPSIVHAAASRGVTGVDLSTSAWCQWDASRTALPFGCSATSGTPRTPCRKRSSPSGAPRRRSEPSARRRARGSSPSSTGAPSTSSAVRSVVVRSP